MDKHSKRVCWARRVGQIKCMSNGATMVSAMVYKVVEHFLPAQPARSAINKREDDRLGKLIFAEASGISLQPII